LVYAWPIARVTIVGAETAASVIFAKEIKNAEDPAAVAAERIRQYRDLDENPYCGAERGYIDDVIMPSETRKFISRALDILENKHVVRPWRKYSNINLENTGQECRSAKHNSIPDENRVIFVLKRKGGRKKTRPPESIQDKQFTGGSFLNFPEYKVLQQIFTG
ncbi:MAG: carboxyl transferase domain-containing protein, partial [Desulfotomaculales bacterium]